jgi:GT2 family glycosyltransferase
VSAALRLGVVVPCRHEAEVIGRKIRNLALADWPEGAAHRIVLVDDGSTDATAAIARETLAEVFAGRTGVACEVRIHTGRPGKPGAVGAGLEALAGTVDVLILTDADVVLEPGALVAIARAFAQDPRLAMASGTQRFVRDLADDGTWRSATRGPLADAAEPFDRWTARVRRLESRSGRLFSVHGQFLAWRAALGLRPRPGLAADDLDLMLQVRARAQEPRRVALVPGAAFAERKTPAGPARRAQALRRARAYVQLVRSDAPRAADTASRGQAFLYRVLPLASPGLTLLVPLASAVLLGILVAPGAAWIVVIATVLALTSPVGWRWLKLALLIREAKRLERESALPERWEMARR